MKRGVFRHFKLRMFRGLFTSMLGVVLLTCGIMGIIMLNHSMRRMREEETRLVESKLYSIAVDLESQMSSMREILADVAAHQEFRWDYVSTNKYNEIQAMSLMKNYDRTSDIWDLCFLKYQNYDNILGSDGNVTDFEVYMNAYYGKESIEEVEHLLEQVYQADEKQCMVYSNGKSSLFLLPALQVGENKKSKMVVGFEVPRKFIEKRVAELVGELDGEIHISYNGRVIYGEAFSREKEEEVLQSPSTAGDFAVYYTRPEHDYFSWRSVFTAKSMFIFLVLGIFMLLLIFGLTVWNYRPVRRLAAKYIPTDGGEVKSALESIDQLIDDLQKSKEKDDRMLQEQYRALKEQVAYMVISGYNLDTLKNYMTLLNIDYNNSIFGIVTCQIQERTVPDMGALIEAIGDLSDREVLLYPCYHKETGLNVLVVAEEGYQFSESVELLRSLFIAMKLNITAKLTQQSTNLEDWWEVSEEEAADDTEPEKPSENMKSIVKQMLRYVEKHLADYDLSLGVVAQKLDSHPSYLSRVFKQEMGIGFKEYVVEMRITKAKELLSDHGYSVGEACQRVGYANTSYFIKLFQRSTGMTPAKFKEKCDENNV